MMPVRILILRARSLVSEKVRVTGLYGPDMACLRAYRGRPLPSS
jgi:hypothetical protein